MAGASAEGEVNHWPAFVDVLTTVIMVVTFLLVIMSAAVMTLSQRVMQNFKEQLIAQQKQKQEQERPRSRDAAAASDASARPRLVSPEAEAGTSVAELGAVLRSETAVGSERLTIRTRETPDTLKLQVKSIETPDDSKGARVQTADVLLRVDFEPNAIKYEDENAAKVLAFLKAKARPGLTYEIWSFAPQGASVTEAQRLSYYRAAMTRNILIRAGISPAKIQTQVRVTDPASKDGHNVRVVLKP